MGGKVFEAKSNQNSCFRIIHPLPTKYTYIGGEGGKGRINPNISSNHKTFVYQTRETGREISNQKAEKHHSENIKSEVNQISEGCWRKWKLKTFLRPQRNDGL
jgi:hypothetical protein